MTTIGVAAQHDEGGPEPAPSLAGYFAEACEAWDEFPNDTKIRRVLRDRLGDDFPIWRQFTKRLFSEPLPRKRNPARPGESFFEHARDAIGNLFAADDDDEDARSNPEAWTALVSFFVYYECLVAWEYLDRHVQINQTVEALESVLGQRPGYQGLLSDGHVDVVDDVTACQSIVLAVVAQARALRKELDTENALFCSCPMQFQRMAGEVEPADDFGWLEDEAIDVSDGPRRLAEALQADADEIGRYFRLLEQHVAPAVMFFDWALMDRTAAAEEVSATFGGSSIRAVEGLLEVSAAEAGLVAASLSEDESVFGSEARSHQEALLAMRDGLAKPSIVVRKGKIVFIYPFALPDLREGQAVEPARLVTDVLEGSKISTLLGFPITVDYLEQTDTWLDHGSKTSAAHTNLGAKLVFSDRQLLVESTEPSRFLSPSLEVRLNSLGNHYVRVEFTTDQSSVANPEEKPWPDAAALDPESAEDAADDGPEKIIWTPHVIEQFVRRTANEVGKERMWLEPIANLNGARTARDPEDEYASSGEETDYGRLVELVEDLLVSLVCSLKGHDQATDDYNDLQANVNVIIVVEDAVALEPDGSERPIEDASELPELLGSTAFLLPRRPLPSSLEEWVRYPVPPVRNLLGGIGLPRDWISRNRDVTVIWPRSSPNWALLTHLELVEFSASLGGLYAAWSIWFQRELRRIVDEKVVKTALDRDDLRGLLEQSADISERVSHVRSLLDHVESAQLTRTAFERELLRRLGREGGLRPARRSLDASIEALTTLREAVALNAEKLNEERARKRDEARATAESKVEMLLAIAALFALTGVFDWTNVGWGLVSRRAFIIELVLFVIFLMIGLGVMLPVLRNLFRREPKNDPPHQVEPRP